MTTLAPTSTAADLLLSHLDAIAEAPGGVARLRQLILQIVVQVRLVEQYPADEPASALQELNGAVTVQPPMPPAQPAPALDLDAYVVLVAWAVRRHQGTAYARSLGHLKLEKIAHLGEAYAGIYLGRRPRAMPHGPVDFDLLEWVIAHGRELDAFNAPPRAGAAWGYQFVALPQINAVTGRFEEVFGAHAERLAKIVELLVPLKSRQAEAVATLYAVWNDLLRAGAEPDDEQILAVFPAFHPKKEHFQQEVLDADSPGCAGARGGARWRGQADNAGGSTAGAGRTDPGANAGRARRLRRSCRAAGRARRPDQLRSPGRHGNRRGGGAGAAEAAGRHRPGPPGGGAAGGAVCAGGRWVLRATP